MKERYRNWVGLLGCGAALLLIVVALVRATGWYFLGVVASAVVLLAIGEGIRQRKHRGLIRRFHRERPGKDLLIVYTDSPHWARYIEERWLTRWPDRAVVLNRSRPWTHDQIEPQVWRAYAGRFAHTPLAIVLPRSGRPSVVRFWQAFRDFKHGKEASLREAEAKLEAALLRSRP